MRLSPVSLLTDLQKEYLEKTRTDEFKEHFKRRTVIERGNGELKGRRRPGLRKAMYNGKEMMTVQTAVAVFTHNLKKILLKKGQK